MHLDKPNINAIFHLHEPRILAVLDWELSTLGHPLVDLAYLCMRYHLSAEQFRGLGGMDLAALQIPSEAECVADYCRLRRRDNGLGMGRYAPERSCRSVHPWHASRERERRVAESYRYTGRCRNQ